MRRVRETLLIFRFAAIGGWQDFRAMYTFRSWIFEWLLRIVFQVIFFSLVGKLAGSRETVHFIVVGNAVMLASMTVMFVVQSTTWERFGGTLPLLVAAPASPVVVFMGRSVEWIPDALATSTAGFFIVGPLFGLPMPWPRTLLIFPLILLITLTTYMMGTFLGSLVLRAMQSRNLVANMAHSSMMAICGVNVPLAFFPGWVQAIAFLLPMTHGLVAVRTVLENGPSSVIWRNVGLETAVGAGWLVVALGSFRWLAEGGRKDGSIEFGS
jgi:ABC-2 type transport system permease protein